MHINSILALCLLNSAVARAARVVLALYALDLDAKPLTVGILAATFSLIPALLSVPAGRLADRLGARWLIVYTALGGGFGMLVAYLFPGLPAIFIAALLIGMYFGIHDVLMQNVVGLMSNPQNRPLNFSNLSMMWSVGNFIGPLIAGFSIDYSGYSAACLLLALLTLVPVAILTFWGGKLPGGTHQIMHAKSKVSAMLSEPGVRKLLAIASFQTAGQDLYQFYMPVYLHAIGLSASAIGMVLAANAAAMFIVRLVLPRLLARFKEGNVLAYAFYIGAASFFLVPFSENAVILGLISFTLGLGMGCQGPIVTMLMFGNAAEGRSGEALGLRMSAGHLTKMVGPVIFGSIGSAFGLFPVFWIMALMMGSGGVLSQPKQSG